MNIDEHQQIMRQIDERQIQIRKNLQIIEAMQSRRHGKKKDTKQSKNDMQEPAQQKQGFFTKVKSLFGLFKFQEKKQKEDEEETVPFKNSTEIGEDSVHPQEASMAIKKKNL